MYYVERSAVIERKRIRVGRLHLVGLFVFAALVRLIGVVQFGTEYVGYSEGIQVGKKLTEGLGFVFDFYGMRADEPLQSFIPPLYAYFAAIPLRIMPDKGLTLLQIFQALLSSGATLFVFGIGRKLTKNHLTGLLCGLAFALYPIYIVSVGLPQSVTVANFLSVLVIFLTLHLRDTNYSNATAASLGVAFGLQLLIRPAMIGYWPILLVWLWLTVPSDKRTLIARSWAVVGLFGLLTIAPWHLRNMRIHDGFVFIASNGGFNLWAGNNPFTTGSGLEVDAERLAMYRGEPFEQGAPEVIPVLWPYQLPLEIDDVTLLSELELDRELRQAALSFMRENPRETMRLALQKMVSFVLFRPNIGATYTQDAWASLYKPIYVAVLLVASVGLYLARQQWRSYSLFLMVAAYCLVVYTVFHVQTRYRWEIEYMLLILCALPATRVINAIKDRLTRSAYRR